MPRSLVTIDIRVDYAPWRRAWPGLSKDVKSLLIDVSRNRSLLSSKPHGEVALVFADDACLKDLNSQFQGKAKPTNVLSFPDSESPLGGIAIAFETIEREACEQNKSFVNHSKHMILHGFLHLLGYDHVKPHAARLMEGLEIAILSSMGISNPYRIEDKTRA